MGIEELKKGGERETGFEMEITLERCLSLSKNERLAEAVAQRIESWTESPQPSRK